jgi:hypothetical protein
MITDSITNASRRTSKAARRGHWKSASSVHTFLNEEFPSNHLPNFSRVCFALKCSSMKTWRWHASIGTLGLHSKLIFVLMIQELSFNLLYMTPYHTVELSESPGITQWWLLIISNAKTDRTPQDRSVGIMDGHGAFSISVALVKEPRAVQATLQLNGDEVSARTSSLWDDFSSRSFSSSVGKGITADGFRNRWMGSGSSLTSSVQMIESVVGWLLDDR